MLIQQFTEINDGIENADRIKIADGLANLLADSYSLYLKTLNFHWNVTGPMFNTLHLMFEAQYNELILAVDLIAERIRALGFITPGSCSEFNKLTKIEEHSGNIEAMQMVKFLIIAHEVVINTARKLIPITEETSDQVTLDLVTSRLQVHEKTVWMLRSLTK
ncbi:MAG TPA: Dps family protein [Burkholderiales bacterium]|nr:Dps family protein [Burkholderiales bacterium]